jgi:hypothetical protein
MWSVPCTVTAMLTMSKATKLKPALLLPWPAIFASGSKPHKNFTCFSKLQTAIQQPSCTETHSGKERDSELAALEKPWKWEIECDGIEMWMEKKMMWVAYREKFDRCRWWGGRWVS